MLPFACQVNKAGIHTHPQCRIIIPSKLITPADVIKCFIATITEVKKPRNNLRDYNSFSQTDTLKKRAMSRGTFFSFIT